MRSPALDGCETPDVVQVKQLVHLTNKVLHVGIACRLTALQGRVVCNQLGVLRFQIAESTLVSRRVHWSFFKTDCYVASLGQPLLSLKQLCLKHPKLFSDFLLLLGRLLRCCLLLFERLYNFFLLSLLLLDLLLGLSLESGHH